VEEGVGREKGVEGRRDLASGLGEKWVGNGEMKGMGDGEDQVGLTVSPDCYYFEISRG